MQSGRSLLINHALNLQCTNQCNGLVLRVQSRTVHLPAQDLWASGTNPGPSLLYPLPCCSCIVAVNEKRPHAAFVGRSTHSNYSPVALQVSCPRGAFLSTNFIPLSSARRWSNAVHHRPVLRLLDSIQKQPGRYADPS